jgi:hypothetical protein
MKLRLLVAAMALAACSGPSPQPPVPPLPPVVTHPPTMESCDNAQRRLERLQCRRDDGSPWAKTPGGTPFADACKRALADNRIWNSHCIARITDCADLIPAYHGEWCGASDGGAQ